jgi:hypothetical protein
LHWLPRFDGAARAILPNSKWGFAMTRGTLKQVRELEALAIIRFAKKREDLERALQRARRHGEYHLAFDIETTIDEMEDVR